MSVEITSTPVIVLSKTPYRESSLIVVGISPDYGRISLMCSGARKISGTSYVTVDLFRELSVEFTESRSTLKNAREIEILSTNDKLPEYPAHFRLAGKMAAFLLANIKDDLPLPYTYDSFSSVLSHLSCSTPEEQRWTPVQCAVVLKTAFLCENGLLPQSSDERSADFLENVVAAGIDNSALPKCPADYWAKLNEWLGNVIDINGLRKQ
ncbi:MAG: recombination protein O N-terminal domain-containing protein [Lentisphaeria bacterium]|nr:recombination protein O N-terminal domain-containing protein [Lentisphaeria bacterium]